MNSNATVEIIEQPTPNSMRFRYKSEGRFAGTIFGVNSTEEVKTFPSIRVLNYSGNALVIVSCVSDQEPYKAHPNRLVGNSCNKGVCNVEFVTNAASPTIVSFQQLGIQRAKIAEVLTNLNEREELRIDPFKARFEHKDKGKFLNLFAVRLCFQVLLKPDTSKPKYFVKIEPIVSNPIYDTNKVNLKLLIHDISDQSSPPCGNKKIMLFTDKIEKRDISVRFFETDSRGTVVWEEEGVFKESNVHKNVCMSFKTPKYKNQDIDVPVNVFFHLKRRSDGVSSNIIPFQYVPDVTNISSLINAKKRKIGNSVALNEYVQMYETDSRQKAKMTYNIDPNEGLRNIGGAAASNVFVPTQNEQNNQQSNLEPTRQQNYQRPQQNSQYQQSQYPQSNHDRHHQHAQYNHSPYPVPQYQNIQHAQPQAQIDHKLGNTLTSSTNNYYSHNRNFYDAASDIDQTINQIINSMALPSSNLTEEGV